MNRKLIDITPRSKGTKSSQQQPLVSLPKKKGEKGVKQRIRIPWPLFAVLTLCVLGVVSVLGIHIMVARSAVLIIPESREVTVEQDITAAKGGAAGTIQAVSLQRVQEGSKLFSATGTLEKQGQAKGVITVYNTRAGIPQTLVANTRFISEDGKLFRSLTKVVIPGATTQGGKQIPGTLDVQALAAEAGEAYNIGPSNFSLPGLAGSSLYTVVYGKSSAAMTGGSIQQVVVVSQQDINQGKDVLLQELREGAKLQLLSQLEPGFEIPDDAYLVEVSRASSLAKAGAELNQFNATGTVTLSAVAFSRQGFDDILKQKLEEKLALNERILERTMQIGYEFKNVDHRKGTLLVLGVAKAKAYLELQEQQLLEALRGKKIKTARETGEAFPEVKEVRISSWPFWEWSLPVDLRRIKVSLDLSSL